MKIVTLDPARFKGACLDLWHKAAAVGRPDIIVGIRTGGFVVAEAIAGNIDMAGTLMLPITKRRATTAAKTKNPWIGRILRRLPYAVTDRIRLIEHRLLTRPTPPAPVEKPWEPDPAEAERLAQELRARPGCRVLVVDDAVDTGATLKAVTGFIKAAAPNATVTAGALVVTTPRPLQRPDLVIFHDVLCRFPWSHDFHG